MLLKKGFMMGVFLLAGVFCMVPAYAKSGSPELPVIAMWQDGHGYREDGTQITGEWAYDSVNPAGKYVLFGEDGAVVRKAESQDTGDIGEDFTGTELIPAVIALRAETFEGFHGTIQVLLEEKSGMQKEAELNDGNFFSLNICVNSGDYVLRKAEAKEGEISYIAKFSSDAVHLPEKETRVMKIHVTDEKMELREDPAENKAGDKAEVADPQAEPHTEHQAENEEGKEGGSMQEMGIKKVLALFGSIGAACLAGILLLRRKHKKYN